MAEVCFYCGHELEKEKKVCDYCGVDQTSYHRILETANFYYDEGLEKAKVRDLSGAISSLMEALRFYKYHTDARNLLGLCYYERGETVEALSEWVISKNLQPEDNAADRYLQEIQTAGELARIKNLTEKYNLALRYCKDGNRDLARIQLKRIISQNSRNVSAYHLLSLIMMQEGDYEGAANTLNKAKKIDVGDTTTLRYIQEVTQNQEKAEKENSKKRNKAKVISFQDGNDTVVMPKNTIRDFLEESTATTINILIGLVLGLLVCFFLIVPTVRQNARNDAANELVSANETATTNQNNITQLQNQVASLQEELTKYTGMSDAVTSYELLMQANAAYLAEDLTTAESLLSTVNRDLLSTTGQTTYDTITAAVQENFLTTNYNEGLTAYRSREYETALEKFQAVVDVSESYMEGEALYNLAQTQVQLEQTDAAITTYQRIVELFPDSTLATRATNQIDALNNGETTDTSVSTTQSTQTTTNTTTTETTQGATDAQTATEAQIATDAQNTEQTTEQPAQ